MSEVGEIVPVHLIDGLLPKAFQNISTLRYFAPLHLLKTTFATESRLEGACPRPCWQLRRYFGFVYWCSNFKEHLVLLTKLIQDIGDVFLFSFSF